MLIYFAGFDVFRQDRIEFFNRIRTICNAHGYTALIPFDNESSEAWEIYEKNLIMMNTADLVIANLNSFRGKEPDSGTCFEVGYAVAKGKKVIGYTDIDDWATHIGTGGYADDGYTPLCSDKFLIEDFCLPLNLMLSHGAKIIHGDVEAAINQVRYE